MNPKDQTEHPSFVVFGPQSRAPSSDYLAYIRTCIIENAALVPFRQAITELLETWNLYIAHSPLLKGTPGQLSIELLQNWLAFGESPWKERCPPGVLTTPLLVIIQVVQYLKYLETTGLRHEDLLQHAEKGGIHGYCGGFLLAAAAASAQDLPTVMKNFCAALRISVGIGAYSDLADQNDAGAANTLVLRLQDASQARSLVERYHQV